MMRRSQSSPAPIRWDHGRKLARRPSDPAAIYFHLPARDVIEGPSSAEDAAKITMACGVIQPDGHAALAALARSCCEWAPAKPEPVASLD